MSITNKRAKDYEVIPILSVKLEILRDKEGKSLLASETRPYEAGFKSLLQTYGISPELYAVLAESAADTLTASVRQILNNRTLRMTASNEILEKLEEEED